MTPTMNRTLTAIAALAVLTLSGCGSEPELVEGTIYLQEPVVTETVAAKPTILTQSSRETAKQAIKLAVDASDVDLDEAEVLLDRVYLDAKKALRNAKKRSR